MGKFSVIIRCKNEERWIGHTIQSCIDLIRDPEIIIIDNNSKDSSLEIARNFAHDPLIESDPNYAEMIFLNLDNYTPGKALNFGVSQARNELIMIISSHCVLTSFNEEDIISQLSLHACIFGNQIPHYFGKRIKKRYIWSNFKTEKKINPYSEDESRYFMHNALSCFKKKTLQENPFDEFLQGKEDRYWARDIIKKNETIQYDPF